MFACPQVPYDPDPFPHAVIRGGWDDRLLRECKAELADFDGWTGSKDERNTLHKQWCSDHAKLPAHCRSVIEYACQPEFMAWLGETTGESGLMYDPLLKGGGIHRISRGGFLNMHVDFNYHDRLRLYRRLNVLLYLNDWRDEWLGHLHLGEKRIAPERNTMVVFTTCDGSWHGHPDPLACPDGEYRDSIALYYYSDVPHGKRRDTTKYAK